MSDTERPPLLRTVELRRFKAAYETGAIELQPFTVLIGRNLAAVIESHHDEKGMVLPVTIAPYEAVITVVKVDDAESMRIAESLYDELRSEGIDVLLDDRDERPGVKFADAELVGIPFRITLGPKGLANGMAEFTPRETRQSADVAVGEVGRYTIELVHEGRRLGR